MILCKMFILICVLVLSISSELVQGQGFLYRPSVNGWIKSIKVAATWDEANERCQLAGADLASPINEELLTEIKGFIHDTKYSGQYFIGVKAMYVPGEFVSTKGVPLDRMPVAHMVQRLDRDDGDCLSIDRHQIRVVSCDKRLPYFCYRQRKQDDVLTECGTLDKEYKFNATTGSCYKFHKNHVTWQQAYSLCSSESGYLAVLNNQEEAEAVGGMYSLYGVYVGLQALKGDSVWTSILGDPANQLYNVWYNNGLFRSDSRYRCAVISDDLHLRPVECSDQRYFLCEKDPKNLLFTF